MTRNPFLDVLGFAALIGVCLSVVALFAGHAEPLAATLVVVALYLFTRLLIRRDGRK